MDAQPRPEIRGMALAVSVETIALLEGLVSQLEMRSPGEVLSVGLRLVHMLALAHEEGGESLMVVGKSMCFEALLNDVLSGKPFVMKDVRLDILGEDQ